MNPADALNAAIRALKEVEQIGRGYHASMEVDAEDALDDTTDVAESTLAELASAGFGEA